MACKDDGHHHASLSDNPRSNNTDTRGPDMDDIRYEWSQTDKTITVTLNAGCPLYKDDLEVDIHDDQLLANLKDGRSFKCLLANEIEDTATLVKLKKGSPTITVTLTKKDVNKQWESLGVIEQGNMQQKLHLEESGPDKLETSQKMLGKQDTAAIQENQRIEDFNKQENTNKESYQGNDKQRDSQEKKDYCENIESQDVNNQSDEETYDVSHVKNAWYEKGAQSEYIVVTVYLRQLHMDKLDIKFNQTSVCLKFQTCDMRFLQLHEGTTTKTLFRWKINVKDSLDVDNCKYRVTNSLIEMTLRKENPARWGDLEAPQIKRANSGPVSDTWVSTASQPANLAKISPSKSQPQFASHQVNTQIKPSTGWMENKPGTSKINMDAGDSSKEKPTCMVPPLNKTRAVDQVVHSGMTGLENLGNTCFMNSVIQILSNTRELRDYFINGEFQKEINNENPLGTGGKIAVAFAVCLKVLWSGKQYAYSPHRLKNIVASRASQFTGFAQHDAQEFMAFLLDGLHEDLNRIHNKPYTQSVDSDGRPDDIVANEAWEVHKKRNDSFIVDLFQGQYKSKLTCPVCGKVSITFDPFMILPVPLPKKQRYISMIFYSKDLNKQPARYVVKVAKDGTVEQLKEGLSKKTKAEPYNMRVFITSKGKITSFLGKGSSLLTVTSSDTVVVCEVLSPKTVGEQVLEIAVIQRTVTPHQTQTKCSFCKRECAAGEKLKRCTKCLRAAYCDQNCQRHDWQRHRSSCKQSPEVVGSPFVISLPESQATFSQLSHLMESYARHSVELFQPPVAKELSAGDKTTNTASKTKSNNDTANGIDNANTEELISDGSHSVSSDEGYSDTKSQTSTDLNCDTMETAVSPDIASTDSGCPDNSKSSNDNPNLICTEQNSVNHVKEMTDGRNIPMQYVPGMQKNKITRSSPLFFIKPCDKEGRSKGERLEDLGDEPLDLSSCFFLAMDWNNNERSKSYVLVQSKEIDCIEDTTNTSPIDDNGNVTLDQSFELFTEPEVLSREHAWYCPQCKEHQEATKQLSIWRLPNTLIIQLKRFSFRNLLWRDKIDKNVVFPIWGLDLSKFFIGNKPINEPPPIYDLYGVINHHGGILGGHYTSFGRCPEPDNYKLNEMGWRLFDDSRVSNVSESSVNTRAAYVLFYRRRDDVCNLPKYIDDALEAEENMDSTESSEGEVYQEELKDVSMKDVEGELGMKMQEDRVTFCASPLSYTDMDAVD